MNKLRFKIVHADIFLHHITLAKQANVKYGCCVELKTQAFYAKHCVCFIARVGKYSIGYAIEKVNGNYDTLISVFKHPLIDGRYSDIIMEHAINNGAKALDCFATIRYIYEAWGFETIKRMQWDDKYAPEDWNKALGTPNIHYMILNVDFVRP